MALRVVLIYRRYRKSAYSIEELFHTIAGELNRSIEVIEYEAAPRQRVLTDAWQLRKLRADIYHMTGDINYLGLLLPHKKTVLTVHDIGHYLFGLRGIKRWLYKWLWLVLPIRAVGVVTAVSKETQDNITRHLCVIGKPIEVINNCHSAIFRPAKRPFRVNCPIILQVGTKPYKNVFRLIEALSGIKCRLVLIGHLDAELRRRLAECRVDYGNHVDLTHEELYKQYVDCDLVSFVSLGEGFGVPIIEAQAVGRPVITANISPMREVAGEGACLVDPLDVSQIRDGIRKIIDDEVYRNQLMERGFRNVSRYSPATISGQYLTLYEKLALT